MTAITDLRDKLVSVIVTPLLTLLFAVALLVFLYGVVEFMYNVSKGGDTAKGKSHMIWGILGLIVMTGAYAIIQLALGIFGINLPTQ